MLRKQEFYSDPMSALIAVGGSVRRLRRSAAILCLCVLPWCFSPGSAGAQDLTTKQVLDALLVREAVSPTGQPLVLPVTRWEKPAVAVWIFSKEPLDAATKDRVVDRFKRVFSLAKISLSFCAVVPKDLNREPPCGTKADIVYLESTGEDLFENSMYLRALERDLNFGQEGEQGFYAAANATYKAGVPCQASMIGATSETGRGDKYVGAILANGESSERYGNCLNYLAYQAVGVGPIQGHLGDEANLPRFSDETVSILYSDRLKPGMGWAEVEAALQKVVQ